MNISQVTSITPTGQPPYQSQHGLLYAFNVTMADGAQGVANSKSPQGPSYKVGEMVGYEIPGPGRLKVDKKAALGAPVAVQPPVQWQAPPVAAPQPPQTLARAVPPITGTPVIDGAECGMLLKLAWEVFEHNANLSKDAVIDLGSLPGNLWEIAMLLKSVSTGLRTGVKPEPQDPF